MSTSTTIPHDVVAENDFLTDHSPNDKPWDAHKDQTDTVSTLYCEVEFFRYAERAFGCADRLTFRRNADGALKLATAHFCRLRYCPICQWRRSLMWRARFYDSLPKIIEEHPGLRWVFLTLTVRNCPVGELRATLTAMTAAWKRLIERKDWPGVGFVRATEVTRGRDAAGVDPSVSVGTAHPHFHCLVAVKPSYFSHGYIKQERWAELWRECLRADYLPVVDIRAVKSSSAAPDALSALQKAIQETLKYTVKPDDLVESPEWLAELTIQTYKLRFLATGGVLKDALGRLDDETDADLVGGADDVPTDETAPAVQFGWERPTQRYRAKSSRKPC